MINKDGFNLEKYEDGYSIINYTTELSSTLEIPETIDSLPVLKIAAFAFYDASLSSVKFPNCLKVIGNNAFDFAGLTGTIEIPDSVEEIGSCTFSSNQVTSYVIGSGAKIIGACAFGDNPTLESIIVSEENKYFRSYNNVLYDKSLTKLLCIPPQLKNFTFLSSVVRLTTRSVQINEIDTLFIPKSVSYIESGSIFRVPHLKTIHILGNLQSLDAGFVFHETKTVQNIYYHGTKRIKGDITKVDALKNVKVYVCNEYKSTLFASKSIERFGNCPFYNILNKQCTFQKSYFSLNPSIILSTFMS